MVSLAQSLKDQIKAKEAFLKFICQTFKRMIAPIQHVFCFKPNCAGQRRASSSSYSITEHWQNKSAQPRHFMTSKLQKQFYEYWMLTLRILLHMLAIESLIHFINFNLQLSL